MEGSESEAVFDTFNLKPQLFINEVLNIVDDLVDDAFDFCKEHASALVSGDGDADRSQELLRGISSLRHMTQATLNKRLGLWERYCLLHCFSVPEGFSSAKERDTSIDIMHLQDRIYDAELDAELVSLRQKLSAVGSECASRQREVNALEKQSVLHNGHHSSVSDVLRLLDESSVQNLFQEIGEDASELHRELKALHGGAAPRGGRRGEKWLSNRDLSTKLEDLQKAADTLRLFRKP